MRQRLATWARDIGRMGRAATNDRPAAGRLIELDYPVELAARWGYGRPGHPELGVVVEEGRERYRACLERMLPLVPELLEIPFDGNGAGPRWVNEYFQGLDAASLYAAVVERAPATYLEIGSGHSTRFVRQAIDRHRLATTVVAVDPSPRAALEGSVDVHLDAPLEEVGRGPFEELAAGDVLVLDGSHRVLPNSDATVFFTEILPRLPSGLLVYIDDVFLPWDYPPQLLDRWWSEQYLLAAWLLAGDRLEVTLPNFWICTQPELHRILAPLWDAFTWAAVPTNGTGFWVTVR